MLPESVVGKQLSDLTTRKVIILVLAMMFSDPLLSYSTWYEENTSYQFGLDLMRLVKVSANLLELPPQQQNQEEYRSHQREGVQLPHRH